MFSGTMRYFRWSFIVTAAGLFLSLILGLVYGGTLGSAFGFLFIGTVLAILEISLSFDNAIVNANKLKTMSPLWQRRFLTWGILIAVFGMRIVFPLVIVAVAAGLGPVATITLALTQPQEYARVINGAHLSISAFGGAFLMMVGLSYFIDEGKQVDWIRGLESWLRSWASLRGLQITLVMVVVLIFAGLVPDHEIGRFVYAAMLGLVVFTAVEILGALLDRSEQARSVTAMGGLGAFLYLEVLDASFSFDGVIGAFALTQNLLLIAIGLGIGAMYVRSMTIMLVERGTLAQFRYLEHGAFWSIIALAVIMFAQAVWHVPEVLTGLIGVVLIGLALLSSLRFNARRARNAGA